MLSERIALATLVSTEFTLEGLGVGVAPHVDLDIGRPPKTMAAARPGASIGSVLVVTMVTVRMLPEVFPAPVSPATVQAGKAG